MQVEALLNRHKLNRDRVPENGHNMNDSTKKTYLPIDADPEVFAFMWKTEQKTGINYSFGEKVQLGLGAVEQCDKLMMEKMGMDYAATVAELTVALDAEKAKEVANALMFSAINKMVDEDKLTVFVNGRTIKWCVKISGPTKIAKKVLMV